MVDNRVLNITADLCEKENCTNNYQCYINSTSHADCMCPNGMYDMGSSCTERWKIALMCSVPIGIMFIVLMVSVVVLALKYVTTEERVEAQNNLSESPSELDYGEEKASHTPDGNLHVYSNTELCRSISSGSQSLSQNGILNNGFVDEENDIGNKFSNVMFQRKDSVLPVELTFIPNLASVDTQTKFKIKRPEVRSPYIEDTLHEHVPERDYSQHNHSWDSAYKETGMDDH